MSCRLTELFEDTAILEKVRGKLPLLFTIAELESSRAGKIGMEVGSARERILIALLIHKYGRENVKTEIPITEPDVDVMLFGAPISIKTITGTGGVKISWTVDALSAQVFVESFVPASDILLAQLKWDINTLKLEKGEHPGGLFYIPSEVQTRLLNQMGNEEYLSPPKPGTNPRGVEISRATLRRLLQDEGTKCIDIIWRRSVIDYDPYKRWLDYWTE
jgi:hypothetical protein